MTGAGFGPWRQGTDSTERAARCRELRTIVALLLGRGHQLVESLRQAETDDAALRRAAVELDDLAALPRRRVLAALANVNLGAHR